MTDNEFNPIELAKKSKTFCIYPWIHQYVGTTGDVKPCCVFEHNDELGNLKNNTLEEIWNNDDTKKLRLKLLNGEQEKGCHHCNNNVSATNSSRNTVNNAYFDGAFHNRDVTHAVNSTLPDGTVPEHKLYHIDVRFNNLCNFSCRTCFPHFSTNWVMDYRKLHNITQKQEINDGFQFPGKTEDQALLEIIPHLPTVKTIYFAGGEPLIQKEHYDVLNKLIESPNPYCDIVYNTNLSKIQLGEHSVIEYWNKLRKVHLNASIDGSHKKAEYWRHGTNWDDIVNNFKQIKEQCTNVIFTISFTMSWINVINALELHKEWVELGYISPERFNINLLSGPLSYSLKNIPDWKKEKIKNRIMEHVEWLKQFDNVPELNNTIQMFLDAIVFMERDPDYPLHDMLKEFSRLTKKLDEIRNENFFGTFPEHQDINEYMIEHDLHDTFNY